MPSFAQKKQLISYLFVLWRQTKSIGENNESNYHFLPACDDFDRHMRHALSQLNEEQKKIIVYGKIQSELVSGVLLKKLVLPS